MRSPPAADDFRRVCAAAPARLVAGAALLTLLWGCGCVHDVATRRRGR